MYCKTHGLVALAKVRNRLADQGALVNRGVANQPDLEGAHQRVVHVAHLGREVIEAGHDFAREFGKALALGRQPKACSSALAQAKIQADFERRELRADGGLADIERGLGRCEPSRIGYGME